MLKTLGEILQPTSSDGNSLWIRKIVLYYNIIRWFGMMVYSGHLPPPVNRYVDSGSNKKAFFFIDFIRLAVFY